MIYQSKIGTSSGNKQDGDGEDIMHDNQANNQMSVERRRGAVGVHENAATAQETKTVSLAECAVSLRTT